RQHLQPRYPDIRFSMSALGLVPRSAPVEMTLSGSDLEQVISSGQRLRSAVQQIPGADNVQLSVEAGSPEYRVIPDPERMQWLGLSSAYTGQSLRVAFAGNDDARLTENGTEYPIRIGLADFDRRNVEDVRRLTILSPSGRP